MGDTSKHLTFFKVENFKRFESFEMNDIGQFNLIVGDNNVGKTSLLEALLFDSDHKKLINNLARALKFRNLKDNYTYQDLELYANTELNISESEFGINFSWNSSDSGFISIQIDRRQGLVTFNFDPNQKNTKQYNFFDKLFENQYFNFPYIPFYRGHDEDLATFYSKLQPNRALKANFLQNLKALIPDIENIELSSPVASERPHLIIYQTHLNSSLPLAVFGDGALKLFRLLTEIVLNKGGRLMIDEVDTGIHFSRFKEFWRTLLNVAKENDVQLFMTTHNEECIKYFVEVLSEEKMKPLQKDARNISLIELPDKSVKAYTYSYEQLEANLNVGNEIRGGAR